MLRVNCISPTGTKDHSHRCNGPTLRGICEFSDQQRCSIGCESQPQANCMRCKRAPWRAGSCSSDSLMPREPTKCQMLVDVVWRATPPSIMKAPVRRLFFRPNLSLRMGAIGRATNTPRFWTALSIPEILEINGHVHGVAVSSNLVSTQLDCQNSIALESISALRLVLGVGQTYSLVRFGGRSSSRELISVHSINVAQKHTELSNPFAEEVIRASNK